MCYGRTILPHDRPSQESGRSDGALFDAGRRLPVAGLGCLGVTIGQTAFTFGLSLTSAANTGLIFATAPVWGLLLGSMFGLERPTPRGILGLWLSILGVGIVFYEGLGAEGTSLLGVCLVLLAAMGFGAYTVLSIPVLERRSQWQPTLCFSEGLSSCCSLPGTLPGWSGVAWAWEPGRRWPSRPSSLRPSPSRPGKRASRE
jgi:drug/metabolite transporter (DMT)-like permease